MSHKVLLVVSAVGLVWVAQAEPNVTGLPKEQMLAMAGLGFKEVTGNVIVSNPPHSAVMVMGVSEKSPLLEENGWAAFRTWVEGGGRAILLASEPAAEPVLASLGLKISPLPSGSAFHVATLADDQLFEALGAAAPSVLARPGGLLTNDCPDAWPLLTITTPEGGPVVRILEIPLGQGGVIITDAPLASSEQGRLLLAQLARYLEESYRPETLRAQLERLTDIARTRAEEALSLVMTKAGSISPNEMNSPRGDPWYRVPGSSGDRLVITPEIEARQAEIKERTKALRRDARRASQEEPLDYRKIKLLQRDASRLADDALHFFNQITRI